MPTPTSTIGQAHFSGEVVRSAELFAPMSLYYDILEYTPYTVALQQAVVVTWSQD